MKKFAKTHFFSNFAPFFMETTVNTSNFEQFYRTLFPRLVQFAMAYTENEAEASVFRTRVAMILNQNLNPTPALIVLTGGQYTISSNMS